MAGFFSLISIRPLLDDLFKQTLSRFAGNNIEQM